MTKQRFFCDSCGTEVAKTAERCPECGRIFTSVRCPRCGHTGSLADFRRGCPDCGWIDEAAQEAPPPAKPVVPAAPLAPWVWAAAILALLASLSALYLVLR
ncbi:MAG: hypothetical protein KBC36_04545 [Spirochaetia bacterium]|nr:hypothetical protein [Spirochaetia bacterium]